MGIIGIAIWVIVVISLLAKSPDPANIPSLLFARAGLSSGNLSARREGKRQTAVFRTTLPKGIEKAQVWRIFLCPGAAEMIQVDMVALRLSVP